MRKNLQAPVQTSGTISNIQKYDPSTLNENMVREYFCKDATLLEIKMFIKICQHQNLNPFLREVYLLKYGNSKASIVTGKETFLKRASKNPRYQGFTCSVDGSGNDITATCKVYVKGFIVPVEVTVHYSEYSGPSPLWKNKPKTMLRKVALVQALREAFPDELGGLYDSSEINTIKDDLPNNNVNVDRDSEKNNIVGMSDNDYIDVSTDDSIENYHSIIRSSKSMKSLQENFYSAVEFAKKSNDKGIIDSLIKTKDETKLNIIKDESNNEN